MLNTGRLSSKSDLIGATASTLCFLHCLATPLLFIAYTSSSLVEATHPWWWGILDILFLAVSLFAVYWSAQKTSRTWVKYTFWGLWIMLALVILNEKWEILPLAEGTIYLPTLGLILLHFYNRRQCRCKNEHCCTPN
ncbi:MAG: MerC domain-containing protein [Bacteroidota bacterium]